ncbi:hypothetical protein LGK37_11485 [Clostridioides difficile]|nr:hypothetical protein [Clostridioides difficile]
MWEWLGIFNCTVIFIIIITIGGGHVTSWVPKISPLTVSWILVFILVAFAEEILNRGFLWQFYEDVKIFIL